MTDKLPITLCPHCNSKLLINKTGNIIYCANNDCSKAETDNQYFYLNPKLYE